MIRFKGCQPNLPESEVFFFSCCALRNAHDACALNDVHANLGSFENKNTVVFVASLLWEVLFTPTPTPPKKRTEKRGGQNMIEYEASAGNIKFELSKPKTRPKSQLAPLFH